MTLQNKRVVLTGSSSGIGLELLKLLQDRGAVILAADSQQPEQRLPGITYLQEDISTQQGVDRLFDMSQKLLGDIDIFIANAGFAYYQGVERSDWDKTKAIFDTNVYSPIYSFFKMKEIKKNKPFQFVVTASAMSFMPLPGYSLYSASKHALQGFFEAARYELPRHQMISLIYPIATKTAFYKVGVRIPFPNQTAQKVAQQYLRGIQKNKAHIFPSKSFFLVRHVPFLQPLVQKLESHQFKNWRKEKRG